MGAWHENARFKIMGVEMDVFCEDNGYLIVNNEAFDYDGSYLCCEYSQTFVRGEHCGASNEYINTLKRASFEAAKTIVYNYTCHVVTYIEDVDIDEFEYFVHDLSNAIKNATEDGIFEYDELCLRG